MIFNSEEARKIIERGRDNSYAQIDEYLSELRVYTESKDLSELNGENGWARFKHLFDITDPDKKDKLLSSMVLPLSTVDIAKSANKELSKIWEAKNKFFSITSDSKQIEKSLNNITDESDPYNFIKKESLRILTNAPCDVVLIDYLEGKPIFETIPFEAIQNMGINGNDVEWISFKSGDYLYLYDCKTKRKYNSEFQLIDEITNTYERIPARFFLSELANTSNQIKRSGIFTDVLGKFKDYELFNVCHRFTEMYAAFPVIQRPESACSNVECEGGWIHTTSDEGIQNKHRCKSCTKESILLGGSEISIQGGLESDIQSPADVFKFIDPDTKGLTYIKERQLDQRENIYYSSVGVTKSITKNAVNEKQVEGNFESRKTILLNITQQLEGLYTWMVESMAIDNYGNTNNISISVSFGNEFFFHTEEDLQDLIIEGKKAGIPINQIENYNNQLISTRYKGNVDMIKRSTLLNKINPFPFDTKEDLKMYVEWGTIDQKQLTLWANFTNLIKRFERENGDIVYFGVDKDPNTRINEILEILNIYIDESEQSRTSKEEA